MKRFVLLLAAAVMLAAVCFSGCKGAVGIDSGRKKRPDTVYCRTDAGGFADGFGFADKRARIAFGE